LEEFRADPRPGKVNLTVGVYQDELGRTPILNVVRHAEERLVHNELTKEYLGMAGHPEFTQLIPPLFLGPKLAGLDGAVSTFQTLGGSGALRLVADFLRVVAPGTKVWLSQPSWPNHPGIFGAAGLETRTYRYFDTRTSNLDRTGMFHDLESARPGDVVVLHGCCHNPTGVDLEREDWIELARLACDRSILPVVDLAYLGLGHGFDEDREGLATLAREVPELLICGSFSKNFGLYRERAGALVVACRDPNALAAVDSRLRICVRTNYSNPPAHGGSIVATILSDPDLAHQWRAEVSTMRQRIQGVRKQFVEILETRCLVRNFRYLAHQNGMFAMTGLSEREVQELRSGFGIYVVGGGRINVAGLNSRNMEYVADAFQQVMAHS
jgi:aspartate/tyrosine/aromatic aminotransferase